MVESTDVWGDRRSLGPDPGVLPRPRLDILTEPLEGSSGTFGSGSRVVHTIHVPVAGVETLRVPGHPTYV